jgi:hypothetical protein
MTTRITLAALALLVGAAPVEAGIAKRLTRAAGRVAGKAIVHSLEAEKAAQNADTPTQPDATAPQPNGAARSVAGVSPITPGDKPASEAVATPGTTAPVQSAADAAAPVAEDTTPMVVDAFGDSVEALPRTLRENSYFYSSFGTQDPFRSLLAGDFQPKLQELVDMHTVHLVGVIWEPDEIAAMVQDAQGFGYTLRPGDAVKNGSVVAVRRDALVARLNIFGQTTQVTLRLQQDEE